MASIHSKMSCCAFIQIQFVIREERKLRLTDPFGDDCLYLAYRVFVCQKVFDPYTSAHVRLGSFLFGMNIVPQKSHPYSFKFLDKLLMFGISLR